MTIYQIIRGIKKGGGASSVAYELQKHFNLCDIDNTVLAGYGQSEGKTKFICVFCGMLEKYLPKHLGQFISVVVFTFLSTCISFFLKKKKNIIVLGHSDCLVGDIRVVHSVHKCTLKIKLKNKEYKFLLNPLHFFGLLSEHIFYKYGFRQFVAVSESIKDEIVNEDGLHENRIVVIPNGVDTERFNPKHGSDYRSSILNELGLSDNESLLLFVGHEFRRKGLEPLIRALTNIKTENKKVALLVLGQDNPTPFKRLAERNGVSDMVHFLSARLDVERFMAGADIFVFPTNYEPFGLVGIEAMASGTPVLATRVGGFIDYIENNVNGLFIKREPEDIAEKISSLLNDHARREAMRIEARRTAERFAWEQIADRYIEVIQEVAQKKAGKAQC